MGFYLAMGLCFVLWTMYAIPGNAAEKVHGTAVNMLFETIAFIGVTLLLSGKIAESWSKITATSAAQATLMGIGSAVGFYCFILGLSLAPNTRAIALLILVAGISFPMQSALFAIMGEPLALRQWGAIAGMIVCIALFNWKT